MQQIFSGLPAAPGVGIGHLYIYTPLPPTARLARDDGAATPGEEWKRFLAARQRVDNELAKLAQMGQTAADIFLVHREILHDKMLTEAVHTAIAAGASAATATHQATTELVQLFQSLSDDYFASRAADIRDVGQRLLSHLSGVSLARQLSSLPENTILIAEDLTPFDTTHLHQDYVVGIALAGSAPTAHTAILARGLGLPLVCSIGPNVLQIAAGQPAIVDGIRGRLVIAPDAETREHYEQTRERLRLFQRAAEARTQAQAITQDEQRIPVRVNINSRDDLLQIAPSGAEGIGLLRTEYLFQERTQPPTVEEQLESYREIASYVPDRTLTVRLLDIGGDKPVQYLPQPAEANPFLGVRGIRLLLQNPDLLYDQLQALVMLAQEEPDVRIVRILLPMIGKVSEVHRTLAIFHEIPGAREHREARQSLEIGLMIEVPSAALLADRLAPLVDFFSLGTNDLAQYTLAADRVNSAVASLATSLDPSVLHLIAMTCEAGRTADIPVAICGEIASDPSVIPLLLGLGITEVSVAPPAVPLVKEAVRQTDLDQARKLAMQALRCSRAQEIHQLLTAQDPFL